MRGARGNGFGTYRTRTRRVAGLSAPAFVLVCLTISVVTAGVDGFDRGFCEAAFGQDSAGAFVADVDVGFDVFEFFVARAFAECEVDDGANCFGCVAAAPMFSCDPVADVCARALVVVAEADAADETAVVVARDCVIVERVCFAAFDGDAEEVFGVLLRVGMWNLT